MSGESNINVAVCFAETEGRLESIHHMKHSEGASGGHG